MSEEDFGPRFAVAVLATWRISHLLTSEDGPADAVVRMRARLGESWVGSLIDCFGCVSAWVAVPLGLYAADSRRALVPTWLAISGAAFLLESAVSRSSSESERVVSAFDREEETERGLLWREASDAAAR